MGVDTSHSPKRINVAGYVTSSVYVPSPTIRGNHYDRDVIYYAHTEFGFLLPNKWKAHTLPEFADLIEKFYKEAEKTDITTEETIMILRRYPLEQVHNRRKPCNDEFGRLLNESITQMVIRNKGKVKK